MAVIAGLAPVLGGSCSVVSAVNNEKCTSSAECRASFGLLWQCSEDSGLCEEIELHARCQGLPNPATDALENYPPDLFTSGTSHSDTIVIGTMFDQTPDVGDEVLIRAAELAVKQANEERNGERGLDDRLFGVVHCRYDEAFAGDNLTEEEATAEIAKFLAEDLGVVAIVGPGTSSTATVTYNTVKDAGTPIISPSATSESLTTIDGAAKSDSNPGQFWRTVGGDLQTGATMAEVLVENGSSNVVVLHVDDEFGRGLAQTLQTSLAELGGQAALYPYTNTADVTSKTIDLEVLEWDELVFVAAAVEEVVAFIDAAGTRISMDAGSVYATRPLLLSDAASNDSVISGTISTPGVKELFMAGLIRIVVPAADDSTTTFSKFFASMQSEYDLPAGAESYSAQTYDAAWMALYGVAWAQYQHDGDFSGDNIARGLRKLTAEGVAITSVEPTNWEYVRGEFKAGRAINIQGATGDLDYDPVTEETQTELAVKTIQQVGEEWQIVDE
ncbi:MAG: ABC transporter substrate-binding protein [Nannocystaceae bacterium]|nr:ABC transporter substrate-binding protein [Myxococcales bacterium]